MAENWIDKAAEEIYRWAFECTGDDERRSVASIAAIIRRHRDEAEKKDKAYLDRIPIFEKPQ